MKYKIVLPLPPKQLSPNARIHWAKKAKFTKLARAQACIVAGYELEKGYKIKSYELFFFWRDKRRRDRDNASASCKAYLDGISDAIGQDDSEWDFNGVRFDTSPDNPRVEIRLTYSTE